MYILYNCKTNVLLKIIQVNILFNSVFFCGNSRKDKLMVNMTKLFLSKRRIPNTKKGVRFTFFKPVFLP